MSFWSDLAVNTAGGTLGGLAAGALLLYIGNRALDLPARREERQQQDERAEARRRELVAQQDVRRAAYLRVIHHELGHNEIQRARGLDAVREEPPAAANPLFETFGAALLGTPEALEALDGDLLNSLLSVYNRFRTANEVNDDYRETVGGVVLAQVVGFSNQGLPPAFERARADLRDQLDGRLVELKDPLESAIAALELIRGERLEP